MRRRVWCEEEGVVCGEEVKVKFSTKVPSPSLLLAMHVSLIPVPPFRVPPLQQLPYQT